MNENYDFFMVFEIDDAGDKVRLDVTEEEFRENNGTNVLHPEHVLVIVKEELRRIYIWKGAKSPVRKRFISSRVASSLQEELVKVAAFHRCKIVSVDQGDEVVEFLRAFRLESMDVDEKLADMRYIRNIDREKMLDAGIIPDAQQKVVKVKKEEYFSPALREIEQSSGTKIDVSAVTKVSPRPKTARGVAPTQPQKSRSYVPYPTKSSAAPRTTPELSAERIKEIMEKIIKTKAPENYKRQNLILGHTLYGVVSKKVEVFGKSHEETDWEPVKKLPSGMIELENKRLRVYLDENKGIVEAIEILEKIGAESTPETKKTASKKKVADFFAKKPESSANYKSWTVKDLKNYCSEHGIDIPSNAKKINIIKSIKEAEEKPKSSGRRQLPKIPKA